MHSSGNTFQGLVPAVNYCFVHMRKAVAGVCIECALQGQHQVAHIYSQMRPLHMPGIWSRSQILFHTYESKCSRHFYTELTAVTKRIYAHTVATAVIAFPQNIPTRCRIVWVLRATRFHTYVLSLQHVRKNSFGRTLCGMLQQRMLLKGQERASAALLQI